MRELATRSVPLVAALKMKGVHPDRVRRDPSGKYEFIFARTAEVTAIADAFYSGSLSVPARQVADAIYQVKAAHIAR